MTRYFDATTKPGFKGSSKPYFIRFGRNENEPEFDIRSGSVKITGSKIAEFFEPAVKSIIHAIEGQSRTSSVPIKAIFMVGGFATSDYLFSKLDEHFKPKRINILRPDAYLNKAVPEGAISFNIDHSVTSRVSKYTYGIECHGLYDPRILDHASRAHMRIEKPSGNYWVPSGFACILPKDTEVSEEKEFKELFFREYSENDFRELSIISEDIKCYRDRRSKAPEWIDQAPGLFPNLCIVTADVSKVKRLIRPKTSVKTGRPYYELFFDVILLFGLTELKAQIAWKENGVERRYDPIQIVSTFIEFRFRGPASIVYDIASTRED
ncbi:hypothetical protein APHAL10511_005140 [Amanita phalloides]|nr:hypothetical protein APHAL10511_005140 [Amanita phalloides]